MPSSKSAQLSLTAAVELAAGTLANSATIDISVELGAAWVTANVDGAQYPIDGADQSLAEQVLEAIDMAN